ncbi:MAG: class I SAM-dependent methyltransferase [Pseudomonadota bacterium]
MSGFSADWLTLREPMDHASINHQVRQACVDWSGQREMISIVDLGCGTGSNFRSLSPDLGAAQSWTLVDHDAGLLELAELRSSQLIQASSGASVQVKLGDFASGDIAGLIEDCDLVTASALFDLVSPAVIDAMVQQIASAGAAFYTTLTYDGIASWQPEHRADRSMREAFNKHQSTDKGFGPAAGADAADVLATAFEAAGYRVVTGKSAWILDAGWHELRKETDRGWAAAVREIGDVASEDVDDWAEHRNGSSDAVSIVGHEDLFAAPAN